MSMALPKIVTPEYSLVLPLSQKKIKYRPFLSKEEKILLMAIQTFNDKTGLDHGKPEVIINATIQIAQNCVLTSGISVMAAASAFFPQTMFFPFFGSFEQNYSRSTIYLRTSACFF